jgi:hypothetical protein
MTSTNGQGHTKDKTIINWDGGSTLQTWPDGDWQILYAKDSAGNCITLSLNEHDAIRLAYAVSTVPDEQFERMREANKAVYELSYPEARADELRQIAEEIECDGGCEGCGPHKLDRGEFCGFVAADNLRKLASALDLKAEIEGNTSKLLFSALEKIRDGLADTGSTPGKRMTLMSKADVYEIARAALSRVSGEGR